MQTRPDAAPTRKKGRLPQQGSGVAAHGGAGLLEALMEPAGLAMLGIGSVVGHATWHLYRRVFA
ncbi:MAG: hypothetical protein AAFQ13_01480 [Pseudomonadota bacterium]